MAQTCRYIDGFEYASADVPLFWTVGGQSAKTITTGGRFSNRVLQMANNNTPGTVQRQIDAGGQQYWAVSCVFKFDAMTASTNHCLRVNADQSIAWYIDGSGHLVLVAGGTTTVGTTVLAINTNIQVTLVARIDTTASGYAALYLNGSSTAECQFNGATATASNTATTVLFSAAAATQTRNWSELVVSTGDAGTQAANNIGDVRVEVLYPSGAGNSAQMTASAGSNFQCVDEAQENGDTDYVSDSTVGHKDTYAYGDLSTTSGTVLGVEPVVMARKTDGGTRGIASVARVSGVEQDSATYNLQTDYTPEVDCRATDPSGSAWTISSVNGAEFGAKVAA